MNLGGEGKKKKKERVISCQFSFLNATSAGSESAQGGGRYAWLIAREEQERGTELTLLAAGY